MYTSNEFIVKLTEKYFAYIFNEELVFVSNVLEGASARSVRAIGTLSDVVVRVEYKRGLKEVLEDVYYMNLASQQKIIVPSNSFNYLILDGFFIWSRDFCLGENLYSGISDINIYKGYCFEAGRSLSQIHKIKCSNRTFGRQDLYSFIYEGNGKELEKLNWNASKHSDETLRSIAKKSFNFIKANKCKRIDGQLMLTHGDFNPCNVLSNSEGKLIVIDWDKANSGNIEFDLALSAFYFSFMNQFDYNLSHTCLFLKGYFSENTDKSNFKSLVQKIQLAAYAFILVDIAYSAIKQNDKGVPVDEHRDFLFKKYSLAAFEKFQINKDKLKEIDMFLF